MGYESIIIQMRQGFNIYFIISVISVATNSIVMLKIIMTFDGVSVSIHISLSPFRLDLSVIIGSSSSLGTCETFFSFDSFMKILSLTLKLSFLSARRFLKLNKVMIIYY